METNFFLVLSVLSPTLLAFLAVTSWYQPGLRPTALLRLSKAFGLLNIVIAILCTYAVIRYGLLQSHTLGFAGLGLAVRLDPLSVLMLSMISLLAFVVIRFSAQYLDGDERQGRFMGRLAATIASVQMLVLAGNLGLLAIAWIMTSLSLHRLLLFYPERPAAVIAARKKFVVARLGDFFLVSAVVLLYQQFGTGDLEQIFSGLKVMLANDAVSWHIEIAAGMLALAALFKSAQFPTHGWLIEVMETPTPVSALLHAGLLNAGPFLIVRMAFVMEGTNFAPILLILLGGFTALFASVAFLTQTAIKTALGYSSVAHMGFMLLICGLGVYPAAMLHLVAHSFYKAHAFLSSGSAVETARAARIALPRRIGSPFRIGLGFLLALVIYLSFAYLWDIDPIEELALLATGAIVVLGLTQIIAPAMDAAGIKTATIWTGFLALLVATAFFTLESATHYLLESQLPEITQPGTLVVGLIAVVLLVYAGVVLLQILAPVLPYNEQMANMAIHFRNGFYANARFDQFTGALKLYRKRSKQRLKPQRGKLGQTATKQKEELRESMAS